MLANELREGTLAARTEIEVFPSGVIWLDVHYSGRLFIFVYEPTGQIYGVDEFEVEEHGIGTHFRYSFHDFHSARAKLLSLLGGAGAGEEKL